MSKPLNRILFIDDDRYFARLYQERLSAQFVVDVCFDVDHALVALRSDIPYLAAVVDVMMPPPNGCEEETRNGLSTGIWLVKKARKEIEAKNMAVVFFTNLLPRLIVDGCEELQLPAHLLTVTHKLAVPAQELPYLVESAITRARFREKNP